MISAICVTNRSFIFVYLNNHCLDIINRIILFTNKSEYEWNGDKKRGLGDYRIPKTLLTGINGERLLPEDIFPSKGILR